MNIERSNESDYKNTLSHALALTQACAEEIGYMLESEDEDTKISYWEEYPTDIHEFMKLMDKVDQVSKAVREIKSDMKLKLVDSFGDQAVRVGNRIIVGKTSKTWKPYDKHKVMEYVGDDWKLVVNPTFRTTGIKTLAEQRGQDPKVIFESLFEQVENDTVTILPESKAPKYLQKLDDGEIKELGKG
tara:strand:- start:1714 stop:2274 length:561 start_codon:yes stop_codon:yes gene_type:complete